MHDRGTLHDSWRRTVESRAKTGASRAVGPLQRMGRVERKGFGEAVTWIVLSAGRGLDLRRSAMNVSVFGLGYVGCVTAACLARDGHHVIGVDVNAEKVAMINAGTSPIIEPGLADLVSRVVRQGRLSATDSAAEGIAEADVALICVGTPDLGHGQPDYDGLARVASAIGEACESRTRPLTVVLRSTVLPGTKIGRASCRER